MRTTPLPRRSPHAQRDRSEPAANPPLTRSNQELWAQALAYAFLDGDWSVEGLVRRGDLVLGHRRPALRTLVQRVLGAYPRPPWDRPRELASWLALDPAFESSAGLDVSGVPTHWLSFQPAMGEMRWPVPAIPTVGELAHFLGVTANDLAWFADVKSLESRVVEERLRHYRYRWVRKAAGGVRLIESPKVRLRSLQRQVLATILNRVPMHPNAHGFIRGRSAVTFAREHSNADVVVRIDLHNFFVSITAGRVYGVFRTAGYPESVAHALTGLTTSVMPRVVWQDAPRPPQSADEIHEHFMLGKRLASPHLPQGAPTSPALANLCAHGLDRRMAGLAAGCSLRYSRYADDLAMSGSLNRPAVARLIELIRQIAHEEGFKVNDAKTLVMAAGHRQHLAGVVVNRTPNLERPAYDRLRAILHNATSHGLDAENRAGHARFAEHLAGRVSWAVSLNQNRKTILERLLAQATTKRIGDPE